jgi:ABC-2 type transport system ATP-binding protein
VSEPIIQAENLYKNYGAVEALRGVSFSVEQGEVFGLLGPNGAGKSTLMNILATITLPSHGRVLWNDIDIADHPKQLRSVLGYLPQDFGVYPNLNALEFLRYLAAAKGLEKRSADKRIEQLLELVNLTHVRKRALGKLSGGMRQRVGIAQALLNDPSLLIVDEPTAGLDPEERVHFRNLLSDLSRDRIVILSTHIVSDIEACASQIGLLSQGRLLIHATPEDLLAATEGKVWEWIVPSAELAEVKRLYRVSGTVHRSDGVHVRVLSEERPSRNASAALPLLEDAYLHALAGVNRPEAVLA